MKRKASQVASYPTLDEEVTCKEVTRWATGTVVRLVADGFEFKLTIPPGMDIFNEGREYSLAVFEKEVMDEGPDEDDGGPAPGRILTKDGLECDLTRMREIVDSYWSEVGR